MPVRIAKHDYRARVPRITSASNSEITLTEDRSNRATDQQAGLESPVSPFLPQGRRWAIDMTQFEPVDPWPMPAKEDCIFYHAIDLPDGESLEGAWDIRGQFESYIGHYPINGKSILDVGTASGFLSFEAEKAGAVVTSLDARTGREFTQIPAMGSIFHENRAQFIDSTDHHLWMLRNSYWYAWHKLQIKAEVVYARLSDLPLWDRQFDVVIAGAITEHLSDPLTAIGNMARLARDAVIIAFDPVVDSDDLTLTAGPNWLDPRPEHLFTWFMVSRGLYKQFFDNLGFDVEFVDSYAIPTWAGSDQSVTRTTVIARRRPV